MPGPKKSFLALSLIVLLLVLVWFIAGFPGTSQQSNETNQPSTNEALAASSPEVVFPVDVSLARKGDLIKRLQTSGTVRAKREIDLVARVAGEISAVAAYNGKYVRQGDLLLKLDDREYRLAYEKAASSLLGARIEYKTLSSYSDTIAVDTLQMQKLYEEEERVYRLAEKKYREGKMSEEEFARRKRDYEVELAYYKVRRGDVMANKSGLVQAREQYERARMNLEWTEVRAPFPGFIANCDLMVGMQVQVGKVLMKLVDLSTLLVDVDVLESEVGLIKPGRRAEVSVNADPTKVFEGRIVAVNPIVDPKTKTVKVTVELKEARANSKLSIDNWQLPILRPGMFVLVKLEAEIYKDRLLVPTDALLIRDQRSMVFIAQGGFAKWHYVDVGERNEEYLEIKSGIANGDSVLVSGHYTLAHDARIKITR